ncbi:hypothetical protein AAVH_20623, partial [Aphelenchoides avenae]
SEVNGNCAGAQQPQDFLQQVLELNARITQDLATSTRLSAESCKKAAEAEAALADERRKVAQLQRALEEKDEKIWDLSFGISHHSSKSEQATSVYLQECRRTDELEEENEKLRAELKQLRKDAKRLNRKLDEKDREIDRQQQMLDKLAVELLDVSTKLRAAQRPNPGDCRPYKFGLCRCFFVPSMDYDFRTMRDDGLVLIRGNAAYLRPLGSKRIALAVNGKYDGGDGWLQSGYAVAYHGTKIENVGSIIRNGFHVSKGTRFMFGRGVYCTPDPEVAKRRYAPSFSEDGKTQQAVVQVRVKPGAYEVIRVRHDDDGSIADYWLVKDPVNIRPYGICLYAA